MNAPGRIRRISGLILHGLLGALMIFAGLFKLFGTPPKEVVESMAKFGLTDHLTLIGVGELAAAVLLIVPLTSSLGVLMTSGFWGGVICIHMAHGESVVPWSIMLALTWVGAFLREPAMFASFTRRDATTPG